MKHRDLIKKLRATAKSRGEELILVRQGDHEIWKIGDGKTFPVPRNKEINEYTAQGILKAAKGKEQK